jgi:glycosyltransferase involved in cell wall biosynthesis
MRVAVSDAPSDNTTGGARGRYRIAICVQGRFHAFDLACALLAAGHDVWLFVTQPPSVVARSGFPAERVVSNLAVGAAQRIAGRLGRFGLRYPVHLIAPWFGRWVQKKLARAPKFDVLHLWSECAEESLRAFKAPDQLRVVVRGSSHIRYQQRLLQQETLRSGVQQEGPSEWVCAREEREYALADRIVVPSSFAKMSCEHEGVAPSQILRLIPGTPSQEFQPSAATLAARAVRYQAGARLRVLSVGSVCFRKGLLDFEALVNSLDPSQFEFRWVGVISIEAKASVQRLQGRVEFTGAKPRAELVADYAWGDIFLLPTIEDGFPQVLAQAAVSGLPIITTPNGSGTDLVTPNVTGWVVPARDAAALQATLQHAYADRAVLARMTHSLQSDYQPRQWHTVAAEYQSFLDAWFAQP